MRCSIYCFDRIQEDRAGTHIIVLSPIDFGKEVRNLWSVGDKKLDNAVRFIYPPDRHMDAQKRSFLTAYSEGPGPLRQTGTAHGISLA